MNYFLTTCSVSVLSILVGCGGGGGGTPDSIAPTLSGVSAGAPVSGAITLTATATDNFQVSGYCFKNSNLKYQSGAVGGP